MQSYNRGRNADGSPNQIDAHVGRRLRLRRVMLQLSQEQLATRMGITFQQIQKYENGQNRISASRLWDLSRILRVPISFFYEEIDDEAADNSPMMLAQGQLRGKRNKFSGHKMIDPMQREETLLLLTALESIRDEDVRSSFVRMIMVMGK